MATASQTAVPPTDVASELASLRQAIDDTMGSMAKAVERLDRRVTALEEARR